MRVTTACSQRQLLPQLPLFSPVVMHHGAAETARKIGCTSARLRNLFDELRLQRRRAIKET
jgi:hypothetical protein